MNPEQLPENVLTQFPLNRRTVLIGAGIVAAAATAATAACGNGGIDSSAATTTEAGTETEAGRTPAAQSEPLIAVDGVPVGGGVVFPSQQVVVTRPGGDQVLAFSAICTHQSCTVSDVSGGTINCPCHGSKFNLDGSVAHGPATLPLPGRATDIRDGQVYLS